MGFQLFNYALVIATPKSLLRSNLRAAKLPNSLSSLSFLSCFRDGIPDLGEDRQISAEQIVSNCP
ncbi:hypothetical protein Hhel01_04308 [Haloferula helveola]